MALSTNLISGLSSGFDWRSVVDQLIAIDHRTVDLMEDRKSEYETKLSEWRSFNTMLLGLKTAAEGLQDADNFHVYTSSMATNSGTVDGEDLLSVSSGTTANTGTYTIKVTNLATAQKLSSNPFASQTEELGSGYAGDILVNGRVVTVNATDTLADVAYDINALNTGTTPSGVTATVVRYGANDYRLILTSDSTGEEGMSLLNGSSTNLVQKFGWKDNLDAQVKNTITNGAQSDLFTAQNVTIQSLLGLSAGEASSGTLTIGGTAVTINLSTMSLADIKTAINDAAIPGVVASVISEEVDGATYFRLKIEGTQAFAEEKNILNTLGILDHTTASVTGKVSGNPMTSDGAHITPETLLTDIDGYLSHTVGDKIQLTGTQTGGGAVNFDFSISSSTTVADLLSAIETQYATTAGDVVAYVTSEGKIRVDDVAGGGSLSVTLTDSITNGQLEFVTGDLAFGDAAARQREIVAGEDATLEVDGVEVTSASNTIEDVLGGVTLNLIKEDASTTITLKIEHDLDTIKSNIQDFVDKYNQAMTYINSQFSYNEDEETTGGTLFGDGTLSSIKSDIVSLLTQNIWGVNSSFSILGLAGITLDNDLILSIDDTKLNGYLKTNFNDIMSLFVAQGTTSSSTLTYIGHSNDSEAGEYTVHIDRAATQATETGSMDLSAGGAGETLTITQGSNTATVTITADMSIGDIKNAINAELDTEYAEVLVGDQQLQEGGSAITAQTAWANITGTSLENGNSISFSGTNRSGSSVSGTYTISNVNTDTVQGLLSAIETAYATNVTATIDTSGRIVVTDKYTGYSQLSIQIEEPDGKGLNFGTVDVTAGAGDSSQEGRYAMAITATDDGSNHLVLRCNDYGSTSFTVSQDTTDGNYDHIVFTTTTSKTTSSSGTVHIAGQAGGSSGTAWTDVDGASVTTGETITISGTAHNGAAVGPTDYTIDTTNDTVDDLLTAIQTVFGGAGAVDVFIRDGKIYLEDKTAGASSMTLDLSYNGTGTLSLGNFDQVTERDLDLGLINGTVTGQDVAGTINGEAAAGSGRVLRGNSGNANTDGLSVRYSGTTNGVDAGEVKLTLGVAELFQRTLYAITDPSEGYATFKQESLRTSIDRIETQIEETEARLDQKMEAMINRFVAMELALSKIQSMSDWLAGQLNAAYSGWV
ncbi:MAG: flagellar filament capping protein FliD [Deltaproteobacteria bacterium]|nr:flagellar filament capping protein FliD [Deltaproteobacteria bacterium]